MQRRSLHESSVSSEGEEAPAKFALVPVTWHSISTIRAARQGLTSHLALCRVVISLVRKEKISRIVACDASPRSAIMPRALVQEPKKVSRARPSPSEMAQIIDFIGAATVIRTPDPLITNEVLYQLSYCGCICPKANTKVSQLTS